MDSRDFLVEECQAVPLQAAQSECQNSSVAPAEEEFNPLSLKPLPEGKQLKANNWFLTFPKTDTSREEALFRLQSKFKENLKGVLICQEQHKDGECSPWPSGSSALN